MSYQSVERRGEYSGGRVTITFKHPSQHAYALSSKIHPCEHLHASGRFVSNVVRNVLKCYGQDAAS